MGKKILPALLAFCSIVWAKDYLGAELYSTEQVRYGRFEFRMMAASGSGTLSTFFLYYDDSWMGLPEPWREIDMEVLGRSNDAFQSNIITGDAAEKVTSEEIHSFDTDLTSSFHTYAIEWTPEYIAWYFDGEEVRRSTGQQVIDCQDQDQSYRFNTWISSVPAWVGEFDPAILPLYQYINWIKYYEYTPGQGDDGGDFTFSWQDDFDSFDNNRWGKADWTFDQNLVDFDPDNVVVKDGYMILCLTETGSPGHSGETPDDVATDVRYRAKHFAHRDAARQHKTVISLFNSPKQLQRRFSAEGYNLLGRKMNMFTEKTETHRAGMVIIGEEKSAAIRP